jgi:hypothetical protein
VVGVHDHVGRAAAGQRVGGIGGVADVRTGHQRRDVPGHLRLAQQFGEEFPQAADLVARADERRLRLGGHGDPFGDGATLAFVGVEQALRCPAAHRGGELPTQVDRVL